MLNILTLNGRSDGAVSISASTRQCFSVFLCSLSIVLHVILLNDFSYDERFSVFNTKIGGCVIKYVMDGREMSHQF